MHENIAAYDLAGGLARGRSRSWPPTSSSAPARCSASRTASPATCWRRGTQTEPPCAGRFEPVCRQLRPAAALDASRGRSRNSPSYLRDISGEVDEILVVDGSPEALFERSRGGAAGVARHVGPHPDLALPMGKVNGIVTGVRECSHERVVIADDDVRYDPAALRRVGRLLDEADLVRPQNYFDELPWHARWTPRAPC